MWPKKAVVQGYLKASQNVDAKFSFNEKRKAVHKTAASILVKQK